MRHARTCSLGLFLVVLAIGVGCNDDDDDNGGNFVVADKVYNQAFNCSQTPTGGTAFCADANATGQVQITNLGGGNWEVREVPDSGFVATGTWTGRTFNFTATNPAGFTETGSWSFSESGNSFSGSSSYVADNNAFTGECTIHGAVVPNIPPDADPIGACL